MSADYTTPRTPATHYVLRAAGLTTLLALYIYAANPNNPGLAAFYRNNGVGVQIALWAATLIGLAALLLAPRGIKLCWRQANIAMNRLTKNDVLRWLSGGRWVLASLGITLVVFAIRQLFPSALLIHERVGGASWSTWVANNMILFLSIDWLVAWGALFYLGLCVRGAISESDVVAPPKAMGVKSED